MLAVLAGWIVLQASGHIPSLRLMIETRDTVEEKFTAPVFAGAKFEPQHGCYLGAYIELDPNLKRSYVDSKRSVRALPEEFEGIVGKPHAMYFFYQGYGSKLPVDWIAKLDKAGKMVHIALEPNKGLDEVKDDKLLRTLADQLNGTGAKIFLRFASEMNGTWTNYGGDPTKYIEKFRLVSETMKERAPNVAMVWCPYTTPRGNIDDFYPGDNWVDWVGVNMYNVTFFDQNPKTPAHRVSPLEMLDPMYRAYASRKPIMIGEYGTTHFSALENKAVPNYAIKNIRSLYQALRSKYPRVKAINYFDGNNLKLQDHQNNDYTVTGDPAVLAAYRTEISNPHFLSHPENAAKTRVRKVLRELKDWEPIEALTQIVVELPKGEKETVIRFGVDGDIAHSELSEGKWVLKLDPAKLSPGEHRIGAEALDKFGRTIASTEVVIVVRR